jgi:hypothetical protein
VSTRAGSAAEPGRARQAANFVVFQAAWFGAILGAAHGAPGWACAAVAAAVAWHLWVSARPWAEARLVALACGLGAVVETFAVWQGHVAYPSGQPDPRLPPAWLVALWGLLAIALNVTLRWLRGRLLVAAALGATLGPLSFVSGARLGGARFVDEAAALATLACTWAVALPLLVALSGRFDGVVVAPSTEGPHG